MNPPSMEASAGCSPGSDVLRTFELTIWDRAEHWRFYETVHAACEADVRALFAQRYGRGYRLEQIHCTN